MDGQVSSLHCRLEGGSREDRRVQGADQLTIRDGPATDLQEVQTKAREVLNVHPGIVHVRRHSQHADSDLVELLIVTSAVGIVDGVDSVTTTADDQG